MLIPSPYSRILTWCERRPRRAIRLARQLQAAAAPASDDRAWADLTLGWALLAPQDLTAARVALQRAYVYFAASNHRVGALVAEHGLLLEAFLRGAPISQQTAWLDLIARLQAHGLDRAAAQAQITRLRHLNQLGRSREVVSLALDLEPTIAQTGDLMTRALLARTLGIAQQQIGAINEAKLKLEQAALGFAQAHAPIELAKTWFEQARVAHAQGDFLLAVQRFEQARAYFERVGMELWIALCDKAIGFSAIRLGRADYAIATQLRARARFEGLEMPIHVAECDLNLGNVANECGLNELALAGWRRAEVCFAALGASGRTVIAQRNRTEVLIRMGRYADAIDMAITMLPLIQQLGLRLEQVELHLDVAEALRVSLTAPEHGLPARVWAQLWASLPPPAQTDQAQSIVWSPDGPAPDRATIVAVMLRHIAAAEQIFAAQPNPAGVARTRLAQGDVYLALGDYQQAGTLFTEAMLNLPVSLVYYWRVRYGLARSCEALGQHAEAMTHYRVACTAVAQLRQSLVVAQASSAFFHEVRDLMNKALALAVAQRDLPVLLELVEQQRALALQQQLARKPIPIPLALQADYERRRNQLRRLALDGQTGEALDTALHEYLEILLYGRHAELAPELPLSSQVFSSPEEHMFQADASDLASWRTTLNEGFGTGWTVLIYVQLAEQLLVLTLMPDQLTLDPVGPSADLRRLIERACLPRYRRFTYLDLPFRNGQHATPWADPTALGTALIPPTVRARLKPDQRLLIVPSGPLHSLPWGALRLAERWLTELAIIQVIPGLTALTELVRRPHAGAAALLVGVRDFGARAATLPNALASLDLVARLWPGTITRLEDAAATRTALRLMAANGTLRQYGLIHFATHGQLLSGRGMLAHLKLTDDDLLTDEIAALGLGGALVVLAACEGALGEILPGEEVVSLSWALLAGGAHDVIASLWQLYDAVLLKLLAPLYTELAAGHDAPTALALAQRACLNHPDPTLRSPFVWASLTALGSGQT